MIKVSGNDVHSDCDDEIFEALLILMIYMFIDCGRLTQTLRNTFMMKEVM